MTLQSLTSAASFDAGLRTILVANVFDAVATSLWVASGVVGEANPLMATTLDLGFGPFVLGKVLLVGLGVLGLHRLRERPMARVAVVPAAAAYAFVSGVHLGIGVQVAALSL